MSFLSHHNLIHHSLGLKWGQPRQEYFESGVGYVENSSILARVVTVHTC